MYWYLLPHFRLPSRRNKPQKKESSLVRRLSIEPLESRRLLSASQSTPNFADFNDDGLVDGFDFLSWQSNFGAVSTTDDPASSALLNGDADINQKVDSSDFDIWESEFGTSDVPQPTTTVIDDGAVDDIDGAFSGDWFFM